MDAETRESAAVSGGELDDPMQVLVADEAGCAGVLPGDSEQVAGAIGAPQVADAVGSEGEADARVVEFVKRQLREAQRRDRRHRDVEGGHRLQEVVPARCVDLGDREAVGDVDATGESEGLGAGDDQLELEGAEIGRIVQMDVDPRAVFGSETEDGVELADRVAVDACGIDAAEVLDAGSSGFATLMLASSSTRLSR